MTGSGLHDDRMGPALGRKVYMISIGYTAPSVLAYPDTYIFSLWLVTEPDRYLWMTGR